MTTTINREEIQKFSDLADEWWDVNGKFKPLHMFNPIRIEYITEKIKQEFNLINRNNNFLKDLKILDIGCGGGLISEPLARLGGEEQFCEREMVFSIRGTSPQPLSLRVRKVGIS